MVDIRVGVIPPVHNNQSKSGQQRQAPFKKNKLKDRRKSKHDRRQRVRDGVIVTLSTQDKRHRPPDRSKAVP